MTTTSKFSAAHLKWTHTDQEGLMCTYKHCGKRCTWYVHWSDRPPVFDSKDLWLCESHYHELVITVPDDYNK